MADLDTTEKRRSGLQVMKPPFGVMPDPTLAIGGPSREHLGLMYSGITASIPGGAKPWVYRQHTYTLGAGFVRAN